VQFTVDADDEQPAPMIQIAAMMSQELPASLGFVDVFWSTGPSGPNGQRSATSGAGARPPPPADDANADGEAAKGKQREPGRGERASGHGGGGAVTGHRRAGRLRAG
jgi:hypothetical protein